MIGKIFVLSMFVMLASGTDCSRSAAVKFLRSSSYRFSIGLLERMSTATEQHFVFSPLSTWTQLATLLEGARGATSQELRNVTHVHRNKCIRRNGRKILKELKRGIHPRMNISSALILDSAYGIKQSYIDEVKYSGVEIFVVDFDEAEQAAARINVYLYGSGSMEQMMFPLDFEGGTVLTTDIGHFASEWKVPFHAVHTTTSPFYNENDVEIGEVNLMKQTGVFKMTRIPTIKSTVLEVECDGRISMLFILPVRGVSIYQVYENLANIRLQSILVRLEREGPKDVEVIIPRFEIVTDTDNLPELLYDMGAKRMFYPRTADFHGISDYKLHVSLVQQLSKIQVDEGGVTAQFAPEMLISGGDHKMFKADRPFVFMIIDKYTELILFAGSYSKPSLS